MSTVKDFLKKILPPPVSTFNREIGIVKKRLDTLSAENAELTETLDRQNTLLQEYAALFAGLETQLQKLDELRRQLSRLDALEQQLDRLDTVETQLQKLDVLERKIKDLGPVAYQLKKLDPLRQISENNEKKLETLLYNHLDPELYAHALKQWYQDRTGKILDLEDPRSFNEKIQWLKIYDRDPLKTLLADKYRVRDWVREKIGEQYLIPLLGVYDKAEDIDFDVLPDAFVLKANHGSGMNLLIRDKNKEDLAQIRKKANNWLRQNFTFRNGYELHYNDIPRKLIIEQYIGDPEKSLTDYKLWCFQGKTAFIAVHEGRFDDPHMALYDRDWKRLPFSTGAMAPLEEDFPKPSVLTEMIAVAEKLSAGFPFVRVDLYLPEEGDIRFGEMTFTPSSGTCHWDPPEADLQVGELLKLPAAKEG
ncbi:MAG: hypothetical protein IKE21_06745 [Erysipelotrichaceae bacterium]|nr:hypothetical protein [Erysipelotrichaceae bacterium]